jgi:hypothetical protein
MCVNASYVLDYEDKQVGSVTGSINHIIKIQTKPKHSGHGTVLFEMMIDEARRRGETTFTVQDVIGDTEEDKKVMEHILVKLDFEQKDEVIWVRSI